MSKKIWCIGLLVTIVLISGCTGPKSEQDKILTGNISVDIKNLTFVPATITISKGSTVIWTNTDNIPHTVNGGKDFDSGILSPGMTFNWTFEETGTFAYYCKIHPSMQGKVIVT